ncbi:MAG TPA: folylpolyglutamate synthase/dihydrofolate synthase family protein [Dissulfurispiraceae bacterium]|nr:folylpolyglutamate synthase/dihydrofolate synthase family protein [Dissulfurispiraceae bacterium]
MSYSASIDYLLSLQKQGVKLGLEKMQMLLGLLGNPHQSYRSIHIAGTNGKGSVAAMCASMLAAHGHRVALYTSPHLVSFTERMRVDGEEIAESEVVALTDEIRNLLEGHPDVSAPTFFELVTAMALLYFARQNVDWAVIETGMGGRLDATNVILPDVSVITSISMDHREHLGNSLAEIAREKAGIIKRGVPVVSSSQMPDACTVIAEAADERGSRAVFYGKDFIAHMKESSLDGTVFDYVSGDDRIADCRTPLAGLYQAENAAVALHAVRIALGEPQGGIQSTFSAEQAQAGLRSTSWRGRLEIVDREPLTIADGAHNPAAAEALAGFVRSSLAHYDVVLVAGMLSDKDCAGVMKHLCSCAHFVIVTAPDFSRAADPEFIAALVRHYGRNCAVVASVPAALEYARKLCREKSSASGRESLILVTGSLYTVGEACHSLGRTAVLSEVREWR